jgi:hypothetical protein
MASRLGFQQISGTLPSNNSTLIIPTYGAEHISVQYRVTAYTSGTTITIEASLDGINYSTFSPAVNVTTISGTTIWLPVVGLFNLSIALYSIRLTSNIVGAISINAAMR